MQVTRVAAVLTLFLAPAGFALRGVGGDDQKEPAPPAPKSVEKRLGELDTSVADHEKRLEKLEAALAPLLGLTPPAEPADSAPAGGGYGAIEVTVKNKRFQASDPQQDRYSDYVWYDVTYTSRLAGRTRSIKGVMQFCDLFGEVKCSINTTINDPLDAAGSLTSEGIGFEYNQFLDSARWVRDTSLVDMTFKFRVESILFADGTRKDF